MHIWWPWHRLSCISLQNTLIDACVLDSDSGLLQQVRYCLLQLPQGLRTWRLPCCRRCFNSIIGCLGNPGIGKFWFACTQFRCAFLQACDITGGLYLKIPQKVALAQYLLVKLPLPFYICFPPAKTGRCVDSVLWTVGVPARLGAALQADAATANARWLQGGVLLPPEPHWNWLRVLSVPIK